MPGEPYTGWSMMLCHSIPVSPVHVEFVRCPISGPRPATWDLRLSSRITKGYNLHRYTAQLDYTISRRASFRQSETGERNRKGLS